jgi:Extensin-like protein C-terminus
MKGGVGFSLAGMSVLLALAGCGRSFMSGERAAWRHQAEVACMKSGEVKMGSGVVRMEPIEGPGVCGADFPLKVSMLGESNALSYGDVPIPPASIPNADDPRMPRWPVSQPRYNAPVRPVEVRPVEAPPLQTQPVDGRQMRWVTGPPGIDQRRANAPVGQPMSLDPQGVAPADDVPDDAIPPPDRARATPPYQPAQNGYPPGHGAYPQSRGAYNAPVYQPLRQQQQQQALPPFGPMRGPNATVAMMPAAVTPPATLACPLVSALDRWVSQGVQPAALHWFRSPVVSIKQISSYSCREMVGSGSSGISEHAFGNALDIAGFTLADGRTIAVKDGWHGTPEEQGFLHDVQLYACETFSTVLAPGYNAAHYNHIHVDLMRRASGRRPCRPDAIPGEVAAAKARAIYARQHRGPAYTGSVPAKTPERDRWFIAIPGEDGYVADEDDKISGSIERQ